MDRTYLACLIHDLRNPLCKIIFASTLLQKDFTLDGQSTNAEYTALIMSSCTEIISLVDVLLKQEKQEFDWHTLDLQTISLTEFLARSSAFYALLVQEKQQVFDLNLPSVDVYVQIDPRLIVTV